MSDRYANNEVNDEFNPREYHAARRASGPIPTVDWTEPGLRITRLRLVTDRGFPAWDVSYCHGILDGRHVDVRLPFHQLPKRGLVRAIIAEAKRDGVYAKGTGILDCISQFPG